MVKIPHWPKFVGSKSIDLKLDRVTKLLERLGNPHLDLPPVVHIAGTNGKGSTLTFIKSIVEDAGYKVHAYTSPHLLEFNERITISGEPISDDQLFEVLEECRLASEDLEITFFEGTTVAALLAFHKYKKDADLLILETGLGGRLDATNVIPQPALTVITSISKDHEEFLGDTLIQIAGEKAGIIKSGVKCVVSDQGEEIVSVFKDKASELDSEILIADQKEMYKLGMSGDFQQVNARTAVLAVKQLDFLNITEEHIKSGLLRAKILSRLQNIDKGKLYKQLPDGWRIWLDGGHNEAAAEQVSKYIERLNADSCYLIFGHLANRDFKKTLEYFIDKVKGVVALPVLDAKEAHDPNDIRNYLQTKLEFVEVASTAGEAIELIKKHTDKESEIIICGSLYLAGSVLAENEEKV